MPVRGDSPLIRTNSDAVVSLSEPRWHPLQKLWWGPKKIQLHTIGKFGFAHQWEIPQTNNKWMNIIISHEFLGYPISDTPTWHFSLRPWESHVDPGRAMLDDAGQETHCDMMLLGPSGYRAVNAGHLGQDHCCQHLLLLGISNNIGDVGKILCRFQHFGSPKKYVWYFVSNMDKLTEQTSYIRNFVSNLVHVSLQVEHCCYEVSITLDPIHHKGKRTSQSWPCSLPPLTLILRTELPAPRITMRMCSLTWDQRGWLDENQDPQRKLCEARLSLIFEGYLYIYR